MGVCHGEVAVIAADGRTVITQLNVIEGDVFFGLIGDGATVTADRQVITCVESGCLTSTDQLTALNPLSCQLKAGLIDGSADSLCSHQGVAICGCCHTIVIGGDGAGDGGNVASLIDSGGDIIRLSSDGIGG